jgi:hypothetical protein
MKSWIKEIMGGSIVVRRRVGRRSRRREQSSSADVSTSNKEPPLIPMTSPSSQRDGGEGEEEAEGLLGGDRREREGDNQVKFSKRTNLSVVAPLCLLSSSLRLISGAMAMRSCLGCQDRAIKAPRQSTVVSTAPVAASH